MLRFRRMRSLQKFASVHSSVFNHFNWERSLASRPRFVTVVIANKTARTAWVLLAKGKDYKAAPAI